jgi:cellulose-binding protein
MNRIPLKPLTLIALVIGSMTTFAQQPPDRKPRVVITSDPELDDLNTLIRALLYSSEFKIDGLVAARNDARERSFSSRAA